MLQLIGIDGMSSDESSMEDGVKHYRVRVKSWRHPAVTYWLRCFDAAYRKMRAGEKGKTQGASAHLRECSTAVDDSRGAVPFLPRNAYHQSWLSERTSYEIEQLKINETPYNFQHTESIQA